MERIWVQRKKRRLRFSFLTVLMEAKDGIVCMCTDMICDHTYISMLVVATLEVFRCSRRQDVNVLTVKCITGNPATFVVVPKDAFKSMQ